MIRINIKTIPHAKHRYDTVGDWWWNKDRTLEIRVSDMQDWRKEFLVAMHELDEVMLCKHRNISQSKVDKFDKNFEIDRNKGLHSEDEEPGNHPDAPYRKEHQFAILMERMRAFEFDVDWDEYEKKIGSLS